MSADTVEDNRCGGVADISCSGEAPGPEQQVVVGSDDLGHDLEAWRCDDLDEAGTAFRWPLRRLRTKGDKSVDERGNELAIDLVRRCIRCGRPRCGTGK